MQHRESLQTFNFPKSLWNKAFNRFVPFNHEAHGGKLAASIAEQLIGQAGKTFLQSHRLESREGCSYAKVQLLSNVNGLTGTQIRLAKLSQSSVDRLPCNFGESSPKDLNPGSDRLADIDNFIANVFAFAIAIGPDNQPIGLLRLPFKSFLSKKRHS